MGMRWSKTLAVVLVGTAYAKLQSPVSLKVGEWLGDDGNWSTSAFELGSNSQAVNVLMSTSLSEFWAVGSGGCYPQDPRCSANRGGLLSTSVSKTWRPLGAWQLGLSYMDPETNGDYGTDSLYTTPPGTSTPFALTSILMATFNTTDYFNGFFGLGINAGSFGGDVTEAPLVQAVKTYGWLPSYSYGYTAGAHYRDTPVSITLGGYDANRFVPHSTLFTIDQSDNLPKTLVRGIELLAEPSQNSIESRSTTLAGFNASFTALIDSSTPYLWLPTNICDQFADALNLTYNDTLDLFTLTDAQYRDYSRPTSANLTFTLSSFDNADDFGHPLDVPGTLNITIPLRAFVSTLQFPYGEETIKYGEPAIPYFSLRKAQDNSTLVLGRALLQETYLITKYDEGVFSLHTALFPGTDSDIVEIKQVASSPYDPPAQLSHDGSLTAGQKAGIAIGIFVICIVTTFILCICKRRKGNTRHTRSSFNDTLETKDSISTIKSEKMRLQRQKQEEVNVAHGFARLMPKRFQKYWPNYWPGKSSQAVGISEVPDTEILELPAPVPPIELDAYEGDNVDFLGNAPTTPGEQGVHAYEASQQTMMRQLRGPAPKYTPASHGAAVPLEKDGLRLTNIASRDTMEEPSPVSSTDSPFPLLSAKDRSTAPLLTYLPSPISPRENMAAKWRLPTTAQPQLSTYSLSAQNNEQYSVRIPIHRSTSPRPRTHNPPPVSLDMRSRPHARKPSQSSRSVSPSSFCSITLPEPTSASPRSPIDPSRVFYFGSLSNKSEPAPTTEHMAVTPEVRTVPSTKRNPQSHYSQSSLGSNFTMEEAERAAAAHDSAPPVPPMPAVIPGPKLGKSFSMSGPSSMGSPYGWGRNPATYDFSRMPHNSVRQPESSSSRFHVRIDEGSELIHIPQLADKRFSWEEEHSL